MAFHKLTTDEKHARDTAMWATFQAFNATEKQFLFNLMDRIHALESQLPQETPQSGHTSPESEPVSLVADTPPTPETDITARTSSLSARGPSWEETRVYSPQMPAQKSRTTEPTSSTPATDRTIGRSASIGESWFPRVVSHERAREAQIRLVDAAFNNRDRPKPRFSIPTRDDDDDVVLHDYIAQQSSVPSESAGSE